MNKPENDFAKYLAYFLSRYLPGQQNVSPNTISSYRDAFKLFLIFWEDEKGCRAELIRICTITKESVIEFAGDELWHNMTPAYRRRSGQVLSICRYGDASANFPYPGSSDP